MEILFILMNLEGSHLLMLATAIATQELLNLPQVECSTLIDFLHLLLLMTDTGMKFEGSQDRQFLFPTADIIMNFGELPLSAAATRTGTGTAGEQAAKERK
jgi:hypothetical protein